MRGSFSIEVISEMPRIFASMSRFEVRRSIVVSEDRLQKRQRCDATRSSILEEAFATYGSGCSWRSGRRGGRQNGGRLGRLEAFC